MLLLGLLAVPASAAGSDLESSGTISIYSSVGGQAFEDWSTTVSLPLSNKSYSISVDYGSTSGRFYFGGFVPSSRIAEYTGSITLYVSYFFNFTGSTVSNSYNPVYIPSDYSSRYMDSNGAYQDATITTDTYEPNVTTTHSNGYNVTVKVTGSDIQPVGLPDLSFVGSKYYQVRVSNSYGASGAIIIPSFRYVSTETSAETDALEDMADAITSQTEIMQAFYGDIVAILNVMNGKFDSLQAAADLVNTNLQSIITALGGLNTTASNIYSLLGTYLHYLESIAQTAEDIKTELASFHADFLTYVQLLISTVSSESDDIQAKMEEIYNLLIQYLNTAFAGAVTDEVTEGIQGADNQLDAIEGIESNYTGSLSDKWQSIGISDFTIAPGLLSGVAWVSSWWTNLFEATGDFKVILTLGLFFGVCGLVIGMISRASRRAGGGDGDA